MNNKISKVREYFKRDNFDFLIKNFFKYLDDNEIKLYNEFSLQHELGIYLRSVFKAECEDYKEYKIEFERNKKFFNIKSLKDNKIFQNELSELVSICNNKVLEREKLMLDFKNKWNVALEIVLDEKNNIIKFKYNTREKHEIDISIYKRENNNFIERYAIELKYPLKVNGKVPESIYDIVKDIKFIESLKEEGFNETFCLVLTDNYKFAEYDGDSSKDIYNCLRNNNILTSRVSKPTGKNQGIEFINLNKKHEIKWIDLKEHKYSIISEC